MASADNTRRVVLLGKTGSGKSSLANTLFGEKDVFQVNHLPNSGTKSCTSRSKTVFGRRVQLIDTPGFFDTDPRSTELSPELLKCITECSPGPHAFLLVLKMEKYTVLEQAVVALMLRYFSRDVLKYTTVVFTRGDDLPEGIKIEEWARQNEELRKLVQRCGLRCHVIDNKYWNNSQDLYRNNQYQIEQLLNTIDQTVRDNFKKAKEYIEGEMERGGMVIGGLLGAIIGTIGFAAIGIAFGVPCFLACVGEVGAGVLGVLGVLAGKALGGRLDRALAPEEHFKKDVYGLWEQLQKIKTHL